MSNPVAEHYANHLAPIYSWMVGDFAAASATAAAFYDSLALPPEHGGLVIDLGCGHGVHALALARRGFEVLAIDTSMHLLSELAARVGELPIRVIHDELRNFATYLDGRAASLITCMGDTLTHLPSVESIDDFIRQAAANLVPAGVLTLSFRDYATHELTGPQRFIPVRADDRRILTCFLEYQAERVLVHDILHEFVDSAWRTSVSVYPKVRLSLSHVLATANACGLLVNHQSSLRGMWHLALTRESHSSVPRQ